MQPDGSRLFNNPTQGNSNLNQYTINEVQMDYSFFNVREPYNHFVMFVRNSMVGGFDFLKYDFTIPEGNYSLQEIYDWVRNAINEKVSETGLLCIKCTLEANTNKLILQFQLNGDISTNQLAWPCFQLSYGLDGGIESQLDVSKISYKVQGEYDPYYSLMLWSFGRHIPALDHKDILTTDFTAVYDSGPGVTTLTYRSPTLPQAGFDCYAYIVSQYLNNFDAAIYEDALDGQTDLNITGINISDIWVKIPVSYYNFGDRVWYWPRTPYTFNPKNSNQLVDLRLVDQFNRPLNLNGGNFNFHLVFYQSRETNFI